MKKKISLLLTFIMVAVLLPAGCGQETEDSNETSDESSSAYCVYLVDEDGNGLEEASIQLCDDSSCMVAQTDESGCAVFDVEPGEYRLHLLKAPEGYYCDEEYTTDPDENSFIMTAKAEESSEEASDSDSSDDQDAEVQDADTATADDQDADPDTETADNVETYENICPDYIKEVSSDIAPLTFSTVDINGNSFTSDDIKSYKFILYNFMESWCPYCIDELPELESIYEDYKDQGLLVVGVYLDPEYSAGDTGMSESDRDEMQEYISEYDVQFPVIAYTDEFDDYSAHGYRPSSIITDGDGNVYGAADEELIYVFGTEGLEDAKDGTPAGGIPGALGDYFRVFVEDRLN